MSLSPLLYLKFLTFCIIGPQINISSPPPPKNCKVKQKGKKTRTKLGSIEHHLSFVKTQGSQRAFVSLLLFFLGKMEQKPLISYPQIFLKFLLYFMIDVMKKKIVFLNKPFIAFFILQVLKNSDFSYLSLHDFFRLFRPIIIERGNLCKFH